MSVLHARDDMQHNFSKGAARLLRLFLCVAIMSFPLTAEIFPICVRQACMCSRTKLCGMGRLQSVQRYRCDVPKDGMHRRMFPYLQSLLLRPVLEFFYLTIRSSMHVTCGAAILLIWFYPAMHTAGKLCCAGTGYMHLGRGSFRVMCMVCTMVAWRFAAAFPIPLHPFRVCLIHGRLFCCIYKFVLYV